jgi:Zn-dependent peptidase ImmA (M78 family)
MRKPNFANAANEAAALLDKFGFYAPPIDPEIIAQGEGLRIVYAQFEPPHNEKVSGFFRLSDKTIYVNDEISGNRITFTIAHEMAHYFLHQDYIKGNDYVPMPRNNEYEGPKPPEEVEADTFAANLLVPLSMLKKYADVATVTELTRLFFVSEEVIRHRLSLLRRHPGLAA